MLQVVDMKLCVFNPPSHLPSENEHRIKVGKKEPNYVFKVWSQLPKSVDLETKISSG